MLALCNVIQNWRSARYGHLFHDSYVPGAGSLAALCSLKESESASTSYWVRSSGMGYLRIRRARPAFGEHDADLAGPRSH